MSRPEDPSPQGPGRRFLAGCAHQERGKAIAPSLETMQALMARLGHPERRIETLHVTGTNGKSSTARYAAALLAAAERRVGLYTSPHLHDLEERVELAGSPIGRGALEACLAEVAGAAEGLTPSFFEALTAAALHAFVEAGCSAAVVEVGILGRWDPTNVVASEVAVITNVGRDHLDYAGPEPGAVAREKAGIVKATTRACVVGEARQELLAAVEAERPRRLLVAGRDFHAEPVRPGKGGRRSWRLSRPGADPVEAHFASAFHAQNAATALAAVEAFVGAPLEGHLARGALEGVHLPGRAQVCSRAPFVLADVAHNPEAAAALRAVLDEELDEGRPVVFVVGLTGARQASEVLGPLVRPGDTVLAVDPEGGPGPVAPELVAAEAAALGASAEVCGGLGEAFGAALGLAGRQEAAVVVTGSFKVVGPFLDRFGRAGGPGAL